MKSLDEIYNSIAEEEYDEPIPRVRVEKKSNARTYLQSVMETVEPLLQWTNETVEQDRRLIYLKMSQLANKKSDTGVRLIIDWAKGKNLHPKQFIKAVNKAIK